MPERGQNLTVPVPERDVREAAAEPSTRLLVIISSNARPRTMAFC